MKRRMKMKAEAHDISTKNAIITFVNCESQSYGEERKSQRDKERERERNETWQFNNNNAGNNFFWGFIVVGDVRAVHMLVD